MKTTCSSLATAFTLAMLATPLLSFALERDTSFYVQYCRTWTTTSPARNDGCSVATDIELTSNSVVEVELEVTDTSAPTYMFSAGAKYHLVASTSWSFAYGSATAKGGEVVQNRRYVVRTSPQGISVDGTPVAARTPENFTPTSPLTLFSHATDNWNRGHLRFYWMKIYEPDDNGDLQLEHELRPCMIVDGKMGIYDGIGGGVWANGSDSWRALGGPLVVPAPNGVGDTVALTNALAAMKRLNSYAKECCILLEPGLYNLAGHYKSTTSHLVLDTGGAGGVFLAGLGDGPEDTILLGEGSAGNHRVIHINSLTISNLTVTGGYISSDSNGGGIVTSASATVPAGSVIDCIVSNNYAKGSNGNGGGGIYGAKLVKNCLIAGNTTPRVGGGLRTCSVVEDCVVSNNMASSNGGGISSGKSIRCLIIGNRAANNGGGQSNGTAIDCTFIGNAAHVGGNAGNGGGLYSAVATNCVFVGNSDNNSNGSYGATAANSRLFDCTITNSFARRSIFNNCHLTRCHVANVGANQNNSTYSFRVFGRYTYNGTYTDFYTNVNCVVENVTLSNAADRVAVASTFVNCTIRNSEGKTNGPLNNDCTAINTIVSGCTPYDVTASTAPIMTNCLYQTSSGEFAEGRLTYCIKASPKFEPDGELPHLTIRRASPAYNAGREDDWILNLVGDIDFAGNPRVKFDRIDIGALERQSDLLPGLRFSVQ